MTSTATPLSRGAGRPAAAWERWGGGLSLSPAVCLLGSLIVFLPLIEGGTTHLPVLITRLSFLAAAFVWLLHRMQTGVIVFRKTALAFPVLMFLGWTGLSLFWSPYKSVSVQWFIGLIMDAVLLGIVLEGVQSGRQVRQLATVLLGTGIAQGMLGIVQSVWFGKDRAVGTFYNPNFFATYEIAILSLALGLLSVVPRNELGWWKRVGLWGTVGITFGAFMFAQSRGALLALLVVVGFIGLIRFGKIAVVVIMLALLAGSMVPNPVKDRFVAVSAQDPFAYSRVDIWKNSVNRIVDQPWGMGLGLYKYTSFSYRFPVDYGIARYGKRAESAHNEYLQIAVELGIAGLFLFLVGIGMWGWEISGLLRSRLEPWERGLVVGLTGAVIGILAHGAVDSVFHEPTLVVLGILSAGMVISFQPSGSSGQETSWRCRCSPHPIRTTCVAIAGLALAVLIAQPAAGWFVYERGQIEAMAGRSDRAMAWFQKASLIDPGGTAYHDAVARAAVQLFHQTGDQTWLLTAVTEEALSTELNPLDGRSPYRLGTLYGLLAGQNVSPEQRKLLLERAVAAFEQAIRTDPFSPLNYWELGKIRLGEGQLVEARHWFNLAKTYEPNFLPARVLLAELAFQNGEVEFAAAEYAAVVAAKRKYERWNLNETERQFLDVDLYPLGRALALRSKT